MSFFCFQANTPYCSFVWDSPINTIHIMSRQDSYHTIHICARFKWLVSKAFDCCERRAHKNVYNIQGDHISGDVFFLYHQELILKERMYGVGDTFLKEYATF